MSAAGAPAAAAGTITLGDELEVSRVGFGARWLSHAGRDGARALLRRALELGVGFIDTADVYGGGLSEQLIAEALHPYPDGLVVATKGGQTVVEGAPVPDCRPQYLREACERSLERMRVDCIDVYQLHAPDPKVPLDESLGALRELQREGKVRFIGGSNLYRANLDLALATTPLVSVQNQYSVRQRNAEPELETCDQRALAFLPWQPLAGGALAEPDGDLARIAAAHGATPAQVALAWLLQRSRVTLSIAGTASVHHLEENVAAAALRLGDDDLAALDALAQPP